jgi:hypothetical protein
MNRQGKIRFTLVLTLFAVLLTITNMVMAGANIKVSGTLDAVEEQGKVVIITTKSDRIDKTEREHPAAYQVSPYALILDGRGRKTKLDTYVIPTKVEFEVEYTPSAAVIKKIREIPQ